MSKYSGLLYDVYNKLLNYFGPRGWWPGDTRVEIILGAILTQAVSWKNVEKAINNLKQAEILDLQCLSLVKEEQLAELVRPALYHRQKARKIKAMVDYIMDKYDGNLDLMFSQELPNLRAELLAIWGIGPETADSILLYAGEKEIFVIDAYTCRIFSRLGLVDEKVKYHELQNFMHRNLIPDVQLYNEYHALLVALGNGYCKKNKPLCKDCPISIFCKYSKGWQEK